MMPELNTRFPGWKHRLIQPAAAEKYFRAAAAHPIVLYLAKDVLPSTLLEPAWFLEKELVRLIINMECSMEAGVGYEDPEAEFRKAMIQVMTRE